MEKKLQDYSVKIKVYSKNRWNSLIMQINLCLLSIANLTIFKNPIPVYRILSKAVLFKYFWTMQFFLIIFQNAIPVYRIFSKEVFFFLIFLKHAVFFLSYFRMPLPYIEYCLKQCFFLSFLNIFEPCSFFYHITESHSRIPNIVWSSSC